eukprot:3966836-Amphidinium_carterae.3
MQQRRRFRFGLLLWFYDSLLFVWQCTGLHLHPAVIEAGFGPQVLLTGVLGNVGCCVGALRGTSCDAMSTEKEMNFTSACMLTLRPSFRVTLNIPIFMKPSTLSN